MIERVKPYWQVIPQILGYQIITKVCLSAFLYLLRWFAMWVLSTTGHVAVSTGDFSFLFTTFQGWILILVAFLGLFFYAVLDISMLVAFSSKLIEGDPHPIKEASARESRRFRGFSTLRASA